MTNYLQKIESTQEIIKKVHLDIICLPKNTCLDVLRRILLQHRCWPFGIYFSASSLSAFSLQVFLIQ